LLADPIVMKVVGFVIPLLLHAGTIATMMPDDFDALTKSLEAAKDYADAIVKPPLHQLGGILSDTVGYWRLKNRVRVLLRAKAYCDEQGVSPAKLLPDVFVPLIDEAGNTEDESLSDMFARLLATHLDASQSGKVHPAFAKTLGQLTALDARVLRVIDALDEHNWRHRKDPKMQGVMSSVTVVQNARKRFKVTADSAQVSLSNLERLGLCKEYILEPDLAGVEERTYRVTAYGAEERHEKFYRQFFDKPWKPKEKCASPTENTPQG
jgi:hypothetical protein